MEGLPPIDRASAELAQLPAGLEGQLLAERFRGLRRQILLLYAVVLVNMVGFDLSSGHGAWIAAAFTCPVLAVMIPRIKHWRALGDADLPEGMVRKELKANLRFTQVLSVLFSAWSFSILLEGDPLQQQYVVLFASLAAIASAVALASVPATAKQPLLLIALPIAGWAVFSRQMPYVVVGTSLCAVVGLILRMFSLHDRGLVSLLESRAEIEQQRENVRANEERYELVSRATNDLIWDWDLRTNALIWSEALNTQLGHSEEHLSTSIEWWIERIHPEHRDRVVERIHGVIKSADDKFEEEYPFLRSDGSYAHMYDRGYIIRDFSGAAVRMVGAMQDLSTRKLAEEALVEAASRDPLTGLPNRKCMRQRLESAGSGVDERSCSSALLLLDLDEFKQVNDILGHDAGDALLKELARRLRELVPPSGLVARLGGDEFAIILSEPGCRDLVEATAKAILERLREPFVHAGRILDCNATIGAALIPDHGTAPEDILKNADIALYAAKAQHRGGCVIFQPSQRAELQRRVTMLSLARTAVREQRIVPYYQPKIRLQDHNIDGFEALLRWGDPERGLQHPDTITAAFEDLELAAAISANMTDQVLRDIRWWLDRDVPFGHVAINAAAAEFRRDGFAERLLTKLEAAKVPAKFVQLEVTESVFVGRGSQHVDRALNLLSSAGVAIALDDFGTGYASLRHLKQFPVDLIKVDQSFVRGMELDPEDDAIVRAVVNLGQNLGVKVAAEGVETTGQAARLMELNCDFAQGFLYSKAVPRGRVAALLERFKEGGAPAGTRAARLPLRLVSSNP